jgi:hypothetical protein
VPKVFGRPFFTFIAGLTLAHLLMLGYPVPSAHQLPPSSMASLHDRGSQGCWVIATNCPDITRLIFRVMIVEIKMIFIGTTKFTPKNRSEPVFFGCVDRKRPVLGSPVRSSQYLGRSWTGCGPQLRVLGAKNRTEPDLKTLALVTI